MIDEVLASLRKNAEEVDGIWGIVYLDNARVAGVSPHAFAGYLGALEKQGLYRPVDGYAWGEVKSA
jgi:hypothetical protein